MRFVDLSRPLENTVPADPPGLGPRIEYSDHKQSLSGMLAMFPGLDASQLPGGEAWAVERLTVSTHNGTHVDAPWHFASIMNGGERAWTIDEVPLDWFYRPGVKLDFREFSDGHVVTAAEVAKRIGETGHELKSLDIVLMNTRAGAAYGSPAYIDSGCGFGREATLWLLERGVRVLGTDGWSWDAPFSFTRRRFLESRDPSIIWEGHKAGLDIGYCQIESWRISKRVAGNRLSGLVFSVQDQERVGRLHARRRDHMTPTPRFEANPKPAALSWSRDLVDKTESVILVEP